MYTSQIKYTLKISVWNQDFKKLSVGSITILSLFSNLNIHIYMTSSMISSSSSIHSRNNRKTNTGSGIVWWNVLFRLSWFYKLSVRSYSYFRMHIVCLCIWRHLHFREANAAYIEEDYSKLYWWDELKIARSSKLKTPKHTCLLFIPF